MVGIIELVLFYLFFLSPRREHFSFSLHRFKISMLFFQQKKASLISRSSSLSLFISLNFTDLSHIWAAIPVDWVIYFGMPVVRTDNYKSLSKILGCIDDPIFLPMVIQSACFACARAPQWYIFFKMASLKINYIPPHATSSPEHWERGCTAWILWGSSYWQISSVWSCW